MKQKPLTYVLLIVTTAVWGMISYRIFITVSPDNDIAPPKSAVIYEGKDAPNDYAPIKDTNKLLLNYRDPFSNASLKDTATIPVRKLIAPLTGMRTAPVKPPINWNFIHYSGYVMGADSKRPLALVNINGKNLTLAEGEQADNVKLLKNMKDSIKVFFEGKTRSIRMNL
ncbi:hypothetical protein A0256_20895 [Mucilaginibacter sp. PAMC 26640]|nr:hypothetical protein A0256_20895 [Mucilaginibacter sp. PAMC 26640]